VNAERLGRLARILRVRQRLTQVALAARAGVSRRAVSMLETGRARELRLGTTEAVLSALGARVDLRVLWNGPELDRMLDEAHATLAGVVKRRLERWGWLVRVEVSYNHFGERGRIDLLALHPGTGILVVIEVKTQLVDVQQLLGSMDQKVRLAPEIGRRFGWDVRAVVPAIVFLEDRTTRYRLERVGSLFGTYSVRGRTATSWLRRPTLDDAPSGLLWFTQPGRSLRAVRTAVRVRPSRPASRAS
jgi:transcriptional regulator with XRE-family HTH domain